MNSNKLPNIIPRLSLSNFHIKNYNNNDQNNEINNNIIKSNKFNIFTKTSGIFDLKKITFNKGIVNFRNTNYKLTNINTINNYKPSTSLNDTFKYKLIKEQLLNINKLQNNNKTEKDKKKLHYKKNFFNSKTIINNNKNNINVKILTNNNRRDSLEKIDNKFEIKGKEIKNSKLCEENNDSFINELNDLLLNVKEKNQEQINQNDKNIESDDDKEPDPRINFEEISKVNKSRPQTSYGGLNARRKNLENALKNKNNRPATSNIP